MGFSQDPLVEGRFRCAGLRDDRPRRERHRDLVRRRPGGGWTDRARRQRLPDGQHGLRALGPVDRGARPAAQRPRGLPTDPGGASGPARCTRRAIPTHVGCGGGGGLPRAGVRWCDGRWLRRSVDVLGLAILADRLEGREPEPGDYALTSAAERFGVPVEQPHHAFDDALTTAQLFLILADRLSHEGFDTPRRLIGAGRSGRR